MNLKDELELAHCEAKSIWENHTNEEYRRDQSHWRGYGRWADDKAWQAIGLSTKHLVAELVKQIGGVTLEEKQLTFLEWGPGGGSNLFALRKFASKYYGVDISQSNLKEAQRMIEAEGYDGIFSPILAESALSEVSAQLREKIDIFISTAVFQHFPSKEYGIEVLKVVAQCLRPNGLGIVQIRFDNGNPSFKSIDSLSSYKLRHITANSYALDEFWNLLKQCGLSPVSISRLQTTNNYATYFFRGPSTNQQDT